MERVRPTLADAGRWAALLRAELSESRVAVAHAPAGATVRVGGAPDGRRCRVLHALRGAAPALRGVREAARSRRRVLHALGARLVAAEESAPLSGKSEKPSEPDEHAMEPDEHAVAAEPTFRASGAHASPERERGLRAHGADASSEREQAPRASGAHAPPERPATPRTRAMAPISGLAGIAALLSIAGRWNEISFANATCRSGEAALWVYRPLARPGERIALEVAVVGGLAIGIEAVRGAIGDAAVEARPGRPLA